MRHFLSLLILMILRIKDTSEGYPLCQGEVTLKNGAAQHKKRRSAPR
jgi:hypothetical protein